MGYGAPNGTSTPARLWRVLMKRPERANHLVRFIVLARSGREAEGKVQDYTREHRLLRDYRIDKTEACHLDLWQY